MPPSHASRRWLPLLLIVATVGCTRIVDLDLDDPPRQLVVEARLEAGGPRQVVRLSTTDIFSNPGAPPPVTGAVVTVTDDQGTVLQFPEVAPGQHELATLPDQVRAGRTYTLSIVWEGEQYRATSRVGVGPGIDSLYAKFQEASLADGEAGYRAAIDYTDPAGVPNYYYWEMFVDGKRIVTVDPGNRWRVISRDRFYDGQKVLGYLPFDEQVIQPGQRVEVRQLALTEEAYQFYFAFFDQASGGGSPVSTPPASVRGNVANLTRPERRALGFFLAVEASSKQLVVPSLPATPRP